MKTRIFKSTIALLLATTIFTSCEKNDESSAPNAGTNNSSMRSQLSPELLKVMATKIAEYRQENDAALRGAEFIPAFFSGQGFSLTKDLVIDWNTFTFISGEIAGFSAEMDDNDFYRLNPDSTVTLQLSSSNATGDYTNFTSQVAYSGTGCNMHINYTGPVEKLDVPFPPFTLYFINLGVTNAAVFSGSGQVLLNGTGAAKTLTASWVITPGGNRSNNSFRLQ